MKTFKMGRGKMGTTIVEYLRKKMILTAKEKGSLSHPDVIAVSQQLDRFITMVQRTSLTMRVDTHRDDLPIAQHLKTHGTTYSLRWEPYSVGHLAQNAIRKTRSRSKRPSFISK